MREVGFVLRSYAFTLIFSLFYLFPLLCCIVPCLMTAEEDEEARPGNSHVSFFFFFLIFQTIIPHLHGLDAWTRMRSGIRLYTIPLWERFRICLVVNCPMNVLFVFHFPCFCCVSVLCLRVKSSKAGWRIKGN